MTSEPPTRRRFVGVNLKMYFSLARTRAFSTALAARLTSSPLLSNVDVFILPDFVSLMSAAEVLSPAGIWTGAQNCFWEGAGPFTGEVSPEVLREAGARIVAVGHDERRTYFGETDADVGGKAAAVSKSTMIPLVCIGEKTRPQTDADGDTAIEAAVRECSIQISAVTDVLPPSADLILAYEPAWAIGAAEPAGDTHVLGVVAGIRRLPNVAQRTGTTSIIYGGSVRPGVFSRLKDGVDGVFLARFGQDPDQLVKTIEEVAAA
jgi:triosephosphate isomerase